MLDSWWTRTRPLVGFSASWWVVDWTVGGLRTTFFGFSGWGFVDGRSHPANPSRDSKIIWLGCRPPALPHIRNSRDSKRLFFFGRRFSPAPAGGWPLPGIRWGAARRWPPYNTDRWWLSGRRILHQKLFGDTSADFLHGKKFMALHVKPLSPYKKACAQG